MGGAAWRGRRVVAAVWDRSGEQVRARLATWGAEVEPAATVPVALAVARRCGRLAAVPRSSLTSAPGEPWTVVPLPWRHRLAVHAVTGHQTDPTLLEALTGLGTELGLAVRAR